MSDLKGIRMCTDGTIGNTEQGFLRSGKRQWTDVDGLEPGGEEETTFEPTLLERLYKGRIGHQKGARL